MTNALFLPFIQVHQNDIRPDLTDFTPRNFAVLFLSEEAKKAQEAARALFANCGKTDDMPTTTYAKADLDEGMDILTLLVETKLAPTRSEARRLVQQGGVTVNDVKVTDVYQKFTTSDMDADGALVLRKGKKAYHKVKAD